MASGIKQFHLTESGVAELKKELAELKAKRLEVAERLKNAKEQLDLSENADWAAAQDDYKYTENRIDEIENILHNVVVIKGSNNSRLVQLGAKVKLAQDGKKLAYTLVGSLESNPSAGKISEDSPVGKALINKKVGDKVEIKVPSGIEIYKIAQID